MKFVKLGDLVSRKIGYGIVQPGKNNAGTVPVIKVNNLISGLTSTKILDRTETAIANKYLRTELKGGELLISVVGTIGVSRIVPKNFAGCNIVRAVALIDIPSQLITKYVKYYLDSPEAKFYIQKNLNTTVQPTLNIKDLVEMPIPMYNDDEIKKIIEPLSKIDEKISINNQINVNLEKQAKSYFYNNCIFDTKPNNWSECSLIDIADYLNGLAMQKYRPKNDKIGIPVLKIKELRQGFCDSNSDICSEEIDDEYIILNGDVVFSWSGSLLVDFWCGGKCGLNQHLFKVTSKKFDKWFFYLWTKHYLESFISIASDKATTMGHIKREHLKNTKVLVPPNDIYNQFNSFFSPIFNLIINNRIENNSLENTRDAILAKLMSGEIDMSNI